MSACVAARPASTGTYNNPLFWERLWRSAQAVSTATLLGVVASYGRIDG
jgi:hypothetical protein